MKLSPHEFQSPLWVKLEEYCEEKLRKHRIRLESRLDELETARLRGQIAELKSFLEMAKPSKQETDAG